MNFEILYNKIIFIINIIIKMSENNQNENNNNIEEQKEENKMNETQKSKILSKEELKELPSYEYIRRTVQKEVQQGLLYISKNNPKDPIKFLGQFLLEKSKGYNA